jgi:hypothetical protein
MKHLLLCVLLLMCYTVCVGSNADETSQLSPLKIDASTPSPASRLVVAGPFESERIALLTKIQDSKKKGVGIQDYMTAFQNLEGMVEKGESTASIQARMHSIDQALTDQLSHLNQPIKTDFEPGTGIIGVKFAKNKGQFPVIETIFPGSAAEKAQLAKRDLILQVDGISTKDLFKEQIFEMLIGAPGTSVRVKVLRGKVAFDRTLKRTRLQDLGKTHPDILKLYLTGGGEPPFPKSELQPIKPYLDQSSKPLSK